MEQYTVDQFLEDVRKEARALRENATADEIAKLNIGELNPESFFECIYGQMAGSCQNVRASELIHLCCPRFFTNNTYRDYESMEDAIKTVNGEKITDIDSPVKLRVHRENWLVHLSSIEAYIMTPEAKNANLISYLKGETDTLEL